MKTLFTALALAAFATTSALAQPPKGKAVHENAADVYHSYSQGNQTFPNPDRDFGGEYFRGRDF